MNDHREHTAAEGWLCRNCNSLNAAEAPACVYCHADRPEEEEKAATHGVASEETTDAEPAHDTDPTDAYPETAEITETVVRRDDYSNPATPPQAEYTFRESVLVTAADIILFIGLFGTVGALLSPMFIDNVDNIRLYSIVGAIALFAWGMISWALLRCVADISRRLRHLEK